MSVIESDLHEHLARYGQDHLLTFWDRLRDDQRAALAAQIESLDFALVQSLVDGTGPVLGHVDPPADLEPAPAIALDGTASERASARDAGEALLRSGKVAAFTVAGGQGTRLGWSGPKGTYPAAVLTGKPLFRLFAEQILAAQERYGVVIPWYIMTSPVNDAATRAFITDNNCFGLERRNVSMFPQAVMPSVDDDGRMLLASPHEIAVNPDGHGGSLRALRASGSIDEMAARGIEHISYFQVDNPNVRALDPVFLGLHAAHPDSSAEMSSKMVRKTDPAEKVGVFCRSGGRTMVVEYSDLPDALAAERDGDGKLRYDGGSIAIHALSVDFVRRLTDAETGGGLPFHRARKKVPHVDLASGDAVEPTEPNAIKFETFVFDALPEAERSIVVETDRVEEFAPIKNATGNDSPATSHALQVERAARWLEAVGTTVPRKADGTVDGVLEIAPATAMDPSELQDAERPAAIAPGTEVLI